MNSEKTAHALAVADALERDRNDPAALERHLNDAIDTLRSLARAQSKFEARAEAAEMLLEVKHEELAALRAIFEAITQAVIEVKEDVLCVPFVGPIDADALEQLTRKLLTAASSRGARLVIVDLTAGQLADAASARWLVSLFRALALLGVRSALSGLEPNLALLLSTLPGGLGVPVYSTLAAALRAETDVRQRRAR